METVTLKIDGEMDAYVAQPSGTPKAGIIVFQEAFGVNPYIKDICERFAKEGYLAIAPELFHRSGKGIEVAYTDLASARPYMDAVNPDTVEADARAAYEWLAGQGVTKVVSIGFCMGGRASFIANSTLPLKAAVSFSGSLSSALLVRTSYVSAPMLFFWGGKDTHIPRETWTAIPAAFDAAGKHHVTVEMGDAGHGFFCNERAAYHEPSSKLAWPLTLKFLEQGLQ